MNVWTRLLRTGLNGGGGGEQADDRRGFATGMEFPDQQNKNLQPYHELRCAAYVTNAPKEMTGAEAEGDVA